MVTRKLKRKIKKSKALYSDSAGINYPSQYQSIKNRKMVSQVKNTRKQSSKSIPQWSRHFVGRINRFCGQDKSP